MQTELYNKKFNEMFHWFTNEQTSAEMQKLEAGFYKKLSNVFFAGDSYYTVLNHHTLQIDFISKEVENILGYPQEEYTFDFINSLVHPDDRSWYIVLGNKTIEFFSKLPMEKMMKYKLRYDFRYKKKNGDYARILYQGVIIEHDENNRLLRSLALNTDITYLKKEGKPVLSFVGLEGEPSYIDVAIQNTYINNEEDFTTREKEILKLLIEGKLSKQISSILSITKQTVDTHRKNMLHKKKLNNTSELIGKAITLGWI